MRVVIAEDHVLLREGLRRLLEDTGFEVTATVSDAEALMAAVNEDPPDVVVTDVRMPPTNTDEGTRAALAIRELHPQIGIMVLSQHVEPRNAVRLLRDHPMGIGYLLKDRISHVDDFVAAVTTVAQGGQVIDPTVIARLLPGRVDELSDRERDVLALLAEGRSNASIAEGLFVTVRTVETHIASIFTKLHIHDVPESNRRVLAVLQHLRQGK